MCRNAGLLLADSNKIAQLDVSAVAPRSYIETTLIDQQHVRMSPISASGNPTYVHVEGSWESDFKYWKFFCWFHYYDPVSLMIAVVSDPRANLVGLRLVKFPQDARRDEISESLVDDRVVAVDRTANHIAEALKEPSSSGCILTHRWINSILSPAREIISSSFEVSSKVIGEYRFFSLSESSFARASRVNSKGSRTRKCHPKTFNYSAILLL